MLTREDAIKDMSKEYRGFVYNKIDGLIVSKIVTIEESLDLVEGQGWKLSPAEFTECEEMLEDPVFISATDNMAQDLNILLNLEKIKDKDRLEELGKRLLDIDLHKNMKVSSMHRRIKEAAIKRGVWPDDDSTDSDREGSK